MPDREKVIYDIERCTCHVPDACRDCSHYTGTVGFECMEDLLKDALELLKEQETTDANDLRVFHCKKCGYGIEDIFISDEHNYSLVPKFCPNCGRKVGEANA